MEKYYRFIGIICVGMIFPFLLNFNYNGYWISVIFSTFYTIISWNGCRYILLWMIKRYPGYELTHKRILFEFISVAIFNVIINIGLSYVVDVIIFQHPQFSWYNTLRIASLASLFMITISSIYEGAYFLELLKEKVVEAERLKTENLLSQYEVLKTQVSPHFLFNSLNTLITIIPENTELAVLFTEKLSEVYRYILQHRDKELVKLQTEIEFVKSYIFLLKIRFGENLKIHFNIDSQHQNIYIAPLTLQILIENAVKHNIVSSDKPLSVEIEVDKKSSTILVKNNLQKRKSPEQSTKLGLQNIINRYKYLTNQTVEIISTGSYFSVALPLLILREY
jgi:two-component system, LytTR family, sensor kinase